MSLIDGGISSVFGSVFGALYPDGLLHRDTSDPVFDDYGNVIALGGGSDIAIKVQRDACSYAMRQADGFVEGDVALIILADGLSVEPTTDMQVTDGTGQRWMIQSVDKDAANSHFICRGRKA